MSLRTKLIVIVLGVALVPMGISAFTTLGLHQRGFEAKTAELHRNAAEFGAAFAQRYLVDILRTLETSAEAIRWAELSPEERNGALWLIYRQFDETAVASLLSDDGQGIGPSVYQGDGESIQELAAHPTASMDLLRGFAQRIPLQQARAAGTAMGEPFADPRTHERFLPVAVRLEREGAQPWFLAVALSLRSVCAELAKRTPTGLSLFINAPSGTPVCSEARPATAAALAATIDRGAAGSAQVLTLQDEHGDQVLVSRAIAAIGWSVVAEQPSSEAFFSSHRIRDQALFWILVSAVLAVGTGLLLARNLNAPVQRLVESANQFARGRFGHRMKVDRRDELGRLFEAFNRMGAEIQHRDAEIRAWNDELQRRVDEGTRELREAQQQLLRSQRLSAVSGLGAGIAHEVNNPLAGVLGLAQILIASLRGKPDRVNDLELLRMLEAEAHRIREIVHGLQRLTETYANDDFQVIDVHEILEGAVAQLNEALKLSGIELRRDYAQPNPSIRGDPEQLQEVFVNLLRNAQTAIGESGGKVELSTSVLEGGVVKIAVSDTGKGIAPEHLEKIFDPFFTTKDDWQGEGLGLSFAHRVVEQHEGRIKASSTPGAGTTMTVTLPAAVRGTTLI